MFVSGLTTSQADSTSAMTYRCIRLEGINSYTTDDAYLDKVTALFARIIAQLGEESSDVDADMLSMDLEGIVEHLNDAQSPRGA